jgi:hypothetical protein
LQESFGNDVIPLPMRTYDELLKENKRLRADLEALLEASNKLQTLVEQQAQHIEELEKEVKRLKRGGKRQAAPFSKGPPKSKPKKPGRKPGKDYGKTAQRAVPEQADEKVLAGCPLYCPECHSPVQLEDKPNRCIRKWFNSHHQAA